MRQIRETFEDEEFRRLEEAKKKTSLSWHDFILTLVENG